MKKSIIKDYESQKDTYESFGQKMQILIECLLNDRNIKYQSITNRTKTSESFYKKLEKKKEKYSELRDMTDICGVRIITYYSDTVDEVAKIIEEQFEVDEINTIDKRKTLDPDTFGYLSLHYVVNLKEDRYKLPEYKNFEEMKLEIQIRSISQHTWAEIEHDLGYKTKIEIPKEVRRDFSRLASLLEIVDKEFIEIREKLIEYTNEIDNKMKNSDDNNEILIDSISIRSYINSNKVIQSLNDRIASSVGVPLTDIIDFSYVAKVLNLAEIRTINEIEEYIKVYKDEIYNVAITALQNYRYSSLSNMVGLIHLCNHKMGMTASKEKIIEFLYKCGVRLDKNKDYTTFSEEDYYSDANYIGYAKNLITVCRKNAMTPIEK